MALGGLASQKKMSDLIDLHVHTTASDGALSPTEVVGQAKEAGLAALAVTDHDTVAGIDEALGAGARAGVEVIAGIEFSIAIATPGYLHLLGLQLEDFMLWVAATREEPHAPTAPHIPLADLLALAAVAVFVDAADDQVARGVA